MDFTIDSRVSERFPGIEVHAFRARGFRTVAGRLNDEALLQTGIAKAGDLGIDREKIADFPPIAAWRKAYGAMKVRPSQFRASIEALLRRALAGGDLALPIPSVNLYNAFSLLAVAPMGAYDAGKLPAGPMRLRLAEPDKDRFTPLGGKSEDFPLSKDLVVYAIADLVLCWGFNCRDSKLTALDAESDDILFFSEAIDPAGGVNSEKAMEQLAKYVFQAGAEISVVERATRAQPDFSL